MSDATESPTLDGRSAFDYAMADFITFRDKTACERARAITRDELVLHPNPDFRIQIVDDRTSFYTAFATDIVDRVRRAADEDRPFVAILPVGPMPQYAIAARMINEQRLPLAHWHSFNMDEYADDEGRSAPPTWSGSFARAMMERFIGLLDPDLRPPLEQVHFPTSTTIADYARMIEDLGGAEVCYGGIGWCGHIAFWESHLAVEFGDDLDAFGAAGPRVVRLHPMTIMQNALHSFGGDWSWVPPQALTIGPQQILGARHRSFWLDGDLGGGVSWQRFIARLVAHGPVTPQVPGSILQTRRTDYTILGGVADDVAISMA